MVELRNSETKCTDMEMQWEKSGHSPNQYGENANSTTIWHRTQNCSWDCMYMYIYRICKNKPILYIHVYTVHVVGTGIHDHQVCRHEHTFELAFPTCSTLV